MDIGWRVDGLGDEMIMFGEGLVKNIKYRSCINQTIFHKPVYCSAHI